MKNKIGLGGQNREVIVFFSDIRGFTTFSERRPPEEVVEMLNDYFGTMVKIINQNQGVVDKFIGDAIMAFWGAPVADADHARHAVMTALDMQRELRKLDEPFKARGWPVLHIGVGVNTGTMTVGDMGSPVRQSYTVMGDAVNLGSRLEGITKQYGVGIIVGETTRALLKEDVVFRELDRVRVKGKAEPVGIYEPLGLVGDVDPVRDESDERGEGDDRQVDRQAHAERVRRRQCGLAAIENGATGLDAGLAAIEREIGELVAASAPWRG